MQEELNVYIKLHFLIIYNIISFINERINRIRVRN
jgi:hypothetical protein